MQKQTVRCLLVCLAAVAQGQGALIDFTSRTTFNMQTTPAAGVPTPNGIDFSTTALCPTGGCPPDPGYSRSFASGTGLPGTATFAGLLAGLTVQGFHPISGSSTSKLYLLSPGFSSSTFLKYGVSVMTTRGATVAQAPSVRARINLPTGMNSVALDLSNGCNSSTVSGCDPGDNHLGSVQVTVGTGTTTLGSKVLNINDPSNTVGEFRFYGTYSDNSNIEWIELSLPTVNEFGASMTNFGEIVFSRLAFGNVAAVPEPSTWMMVLIGAALLLRRRVY